MCIEELCQSLLFHSTSFLTYRSFSNPHYRQGKCFLFLKIRYLREKDAIRELEAPYSSTRYCTKKDTTVHWLWEEPFAG